MGKRIIQQRRGRGSSVYRVRSKAFRYEVKYTSKEGTGEVIKIIKSQAHSAPVAKISIGKEIFYNVAANNLVEGQKINVGKGGNIGDIVMLKDVEIGTRVFNIESKSGDGGKFARAAGTYAVVTKKGKKVGLKLSSGKTIELDEKCRATIGSVAGAGKKDKPFVKAGKKYYYMKMKSKLWPRTSAVAMNVVDHPFGSGRGKNVSHGAKGKIPKRNAPAGAKVGTIRPRRTGRRKRW